MQVSVIIPVYNREKFVEKAVRSALQQPETKEVLLIDDGSTDNSLAIGRRLALEDTRVNVFQHPNGENLGPGAARNVGLRNAAFEYIAFLDSDDWYIENRFAKANEIFQKYDNVDGVYEAVQLFNYPELDEKNTYNPELIMFTKFITPEHFFEEFLLAKNGYCSIVGMIIKKNAQMKIGYFEEKFRQAEDLDFILRFNLENNLYSGSLTQPVAFIGNHNERSVYYSKGMAFYRQLLFEKWLQKSLNNDWSKKINRHIFVNFLHFQPWVQKSWSNASIRLSKKVALSSFYLLKYPRLIFKLI